MTAMEVSTRRTLIIGFAALMALQTLLTVMVFDSPREILSADPILNVDWSSQYYWSHAARSFFERSNRIWGYDPFYMAGYPLSFVFNSSLPVQWFSVMLEDIPLGRVIKLFYLLTFLSAPMLLMWSLRNFGLSPLAALGATGLGLAQFWLAEPAIFGIWGMLSGSLILVYFMLPLSLIFRWLTRGDNRSISLFLIAASLALLIHKTSVVLFVFPALIFVALFSERLKRREWGMLIMVAIFALLVNLNWLFPFIHFLPLKIEDPMTTYYQNTDPFRILGDLMPKDAFFAIPLCRDIILGFAIYGMRHIKRTGQNADLFLPILTTLIFFTPLVYFGSFFDLLRHLQPYRYVSAIFFLLLPAAGIGLAAAYNEISRKFLPANAKVAVVGLTLVMLFLQFMPNYRLLAVVAPLTSKMSPEVRELYQWIEHNTDRTARIMIEDKTAWQDKDNTYGGARFVGILPALLPRECVGGPLPNAFIKHHYASFHDGRFLNRPLKSFTDQDLKTAYELYNIKWVIAWSEESKQRLANDPALEYKTGFEYLEVYEVQRDPDFFMQGQGTVKADYDIIELSNIKPESGRVVIKYHYVKGLKSKPVTEIVPVEVDGDPVGFIGIENPPPKLSIRLGL